MAKDVKRALMIAHEVGSPERQQAFGEVARAQRKRNAGFDPDRVLYHGTNKDIQAFTPKRAGRRETMALKGTHLADNPEFANLYAEGRGANVMPVHARGNFLDAGKLVYEGSPEHEVLNELLKGQRNVRAFWNTDHEGKRVASPLHSYLDAVAPQKAERILRAKGYDGVTYPAKYRFNDGRVPARANATLVFDPENIRSQFAQFDPAHNDSDDIGKAAGGSATKRALMIARDHRNLLRRIANIYPGPAGGMDPSPGGGGYSGPGGGKYIGPSHYAEGGSVPPFKLQSGAAKIIKSKGQAKATPQQYAAMPGIKPDELKHSKFDTLGSKALPREEVIKHLEDNAVPLQETTYTGDDEQSALRRYGEEKTALPGGQNYREVLLHTPAMHTPSPELAKARARAEAATRAFDDALNDQLSSPNNADDEAYHRASAEADNARIALARLERADQSAASNAGFRGGHWDQPNVLAHLRMSDRVGPNGEKILHLEEAQSDWGQQGREQGFKGPEHSPERVRQLEDAIQEARGSLAIHQSRIHDNVLGMSYAKYLREHPDMASRTSALEALRKAKQDDDQYSAAMQRVVALEAEQRAANPVGKPPPGPYVDNTQKWTDLALKRVLHEAAHGGYDKIVVTPGDEQNKRYDLSSQVKNISYFPDIGYLNAETHDGRGIDHHDVKPEDLAKHIGKEAADRILKQDPQRYEGRGKLGGEFYHELEGNDLKMGGAGMRGYYDNILPKRLQALAQQHDPQAKVNLHAHPLKDFYVKQSPGYQENDFEAFTPDDASLGAHPTREAAEAAIAQRRATPGDETAPLHSLDVTPQMRDSIKQGGFNSFKRGGEVGDDPIKNWQWRPTEDVRNELQLDEIPSHVHKFGEFMDESARRAMNEGFTPRDLIKAYTITRASIQRRAQSVENIRKSGLILPPDLKGMIRPEGAFGHWLHTKHGQRYLDEAEAGRVDEEAIADAQKVMKPFGKTEKDLPDALRWAPKNLPGQEGRISELVTRAYRGHDHPDDWRDATGGLRGIGPAKQGFYGANLGYGKLPTLDARQIIAHTGRPTSEAVPYLNVKGAPVAAVNRLSDRQTAMALKHDKSMSPFYQHLAHHTTWDKAAGEQTTHEDVINPMRTAKDGGRQGYKEGGATNILGHPVARALITALGPNWVNPMDEAAQAAGLTSDELAHKLRMRPGDKGDKLSKLAPQTDWAAHSVKLARAPLDPIRRIDPHEIAKNKGTFIAGPGDRQITDAEIHGLNGIEFDTPVRGHGGPFYPRGEAGRTGAAWASAQAPVSKQLGMAASAERLGRTPYHVPWSMSRGAVDSTPMMWELIANLLPHAKINKTGRALIDKSIRSHVVDKEGTRPFRGAPSIASEEFPKWVGAMGLGERYALMTALEKASHIVKGFPEPAALRLAITEPEYVAPRSLTAGRVITQIDPRAGIIHDPAVPHPGYPKQFMKTGDVMGFERPAPLGLMFPNAWKTIAGDLDPEVASVPNNINRAFQMGNISQPVTNEVADNLAAYFAREKGKPFKKAGGRTGYADGGGIDQLLQNLKGSFGQLNQQVAARPQPQAPANYQAMLGQATGQAPNDAYQRMLAQALNGKTYEGLFPKAAEPVKSVTPAVAPVAPDPVLFTPQTPDYSDMLQGGDGSSSGAADGGGGTGGAGAAGADGAGGDGGASSAGGGSAVRRGGSVAPTEAQKHAGNYQKRHLSFHGLPISIETPKGAAREGKSANGRTWRCTMPADYGYIKRTEGADGDHVDVYVGPDKGSLMVFVINQNDHRTGQFDEHKAMLGYSSERAAVSDYAKAFSDGKGHARIGSVEAMSLDAFKHWLKRGKTKTPAKSKNIIEHALAITRKAKHG